MAKLWTLFGFASFLAVASFIADIGECRVEPQVLEQLVANPLETFFQVIIPQLFNQRPSSENGTDDQFKEYALKDESNEDIGSFTPQQLIERAGFAYENHYVLSADGYITQLIHLINPLADQSKLKQPPFLITHGGANNPSVYLASSNIQHHPEPWPRSPQDGSITSWNRSLAFTLANNGYDVWLSGTRGDSRQNQGHTKLRVFEPQGAVRNDKNKPLNITLLELADTFKYWDFSFNEIIEHEFPAQINKVLELTRSDKLSILCFSFSTMTGLPLFASRPEYAELIHQLVLMAPIINRRGTNNFVRLMQNIFVRADPRFGVMVFNLILLTQPVRDLFILLNSSKALRYTLIKGLLDLLVGPSAKYRSNLDQGAVSNALQQTGYGEILHFYQQVIVGRLQKFDHGAAKNFLKYGSIFPPVYDISDIHIDNWILIQSTSDNFAPQASVQQVYDSIRQKPRARIVLPGWNHFDFLIGFENDIRVNLPILAFLDEHQLPAKVLPKRSSAEQARIDRVNRELAKFVPGLYAGDSNGVPDAL